jgi:hypothetical protein
MTQMETQMGADEREITAAMIEAGVEELGIRYMALRDAELGADRDAAIAVFRAMAALQSPSPSSAL